MPVLKHLKWLIHLSPLYPSDIRIRSYETLLKESYGGSSCPGLREMTCFAFDRLQVSHSMVVGASCVVSATPSTTSGRWRIASWPAWPRIRCQCIAVSVRCGRGCVDLFIAKADIESLGVST